MTLMRWCGSTGNRCWVTSADLVVLVPSRGRPKNVARLVEACAVTCTAGTVLHFGFDRDDPRLVDNLAATGGHPYSVRERMGLGAWTNELASLNMHVPYLGSMGDDMVPVTPGWDRLLIDACGPCGMTYPNDRRRHDIPEMIVIDTRIVAALGWMCHPQIEHWYTDNVWADLGRSAGCLTYLPDVIVEHRHPNVPGGDPPDLTYTEAAGKFSRDLSAYQRWRFSGQMRTDIATVRECLKNHA